MTAEWLLQRLRAIADLEMRRRALVAILTGADPAVAVAAAEDLVERATAGGDDADVAAGLACLVHALGHLDYQTRRALYGVARDRPAPALTRLLLDVSPPTADAGQVARQMQPERPLRARGRPLTLGERKALARSSRADLVVQLLRDPHPDVIRVLLDNPRMTERDAVVLAASRPAVPATLATIADHRRWSTRVQVRRALVLNPHTPVHLAIRLATTLGDTDWRDVESSPHLAEPLRAHARALRVTQRRRGT